MTDAPPLTAAAAAITSATTTRRRRRRTRAWGLVVAAALGGGCSFNKPATPVCQTDLDCTASTVTLACVSGSCIERGLPQTTWAIEIVPTNDSAAAPTGLAALTLDDDELVLTADAKVVVTASLAPGSSLTGGSHVVATLPPGVPGRSDQQFEAEWAAAADGGVSQFSLTVPTGALGQTAMLRILPLPPRDSAQPPVWTKVTLAPAVDVPINNNYDFVTGYLLSALQKPIGGFNARAFQAGQLISNVASVGDNGFFRLSIPPENANADPNHFFTIELAPTDSSGPYPRFTTNSIPLQQANTDLGNLPLPPFGAPSSFRFVITDPTGAPVNGAAVTLRTSFSTINGNGIADYARSGYSDQDGHVDLALLPGTADMARPYEIAVVPPGGSALGIACRTSFPITVGASTSSVTPPVAARIDLPAKVALAGTILSANGLPVSGVSIAATMVTADASQICVDVAARAPASGSSGSDGNFRLLVDPGTYQIDYDPPAGAPVPRLTENGMTAVAVTPDGVGDHVVQMMPGALVRGSVLGPDGQGLPSAGVRFFEIKCSGDAACFGSNRVEPLLVAETHTDAQGQFRAILPNQQAAP